MHRRPTCGIGRYGASRAELHFEGLDQLLAFARERGLRAQVPTVRTGEKPLGCVGVFCERAWNW